MIIRNLTFVGVAVVLTIGGAAVPAGAAVPSSGIEYDVLTTNTQDPIAIQVAADGRVIWIEREGGVNVLTPDGTQIEAGRLPVSANDCAPAYGTSSPAGNVAAAPAASAVSTAAQAAADAGATGVGSLEGCLVIDPPIDPDNPGRTYGGVGRAPTGLEEGGLMGLLLAPDFATSGRIYLYRSLPGTFDPDTLTGLWRLSTFVLRANNTLDLSSEVTIFENRTEWLNGSHYGGNLEWLPDGTILMSQGDDTRYQSSNSYGPRDWRFNTSGQGESNNAERTSYNPASRSGKLLRMMPDGSVPDGSQPGIEANPFLVLGADGTAQRDAEGGYVTQVEHNEYLCLPLLRENGGPGGYNPYATPDTCPQGGHDIAFDPYVYAWGVKQPWRVAVMPDGSAYFGDVKPDAGSTSPTRGPRGIEEINYVPSGGGGNYGWPRCIGNDGAGNQIPYVDFDMATSVGHGLLDCSGTIAPVLWYPNPDGQNVPQWEAFGSGGGTSEPVAAYSSAVTGPLRLPAQFDNTLFMFDWTRRWIKAIPYDPATYQLDTASDANWINVLTNTGGTSWGNGPLDAAIGPDGALYVVEFGGGYYNQSNSRIGRFRCAGCNPASAAVNYGLPLDTTTGPEVALASGAPAPSPLGAIWIGAALVVMHGLGRRRRKTVVN